MSFILKNVLLIDCTGREPVDDGWVVVENGIIKECGNGKNNCEAHVESFDCKGMTLMPGLIDAHIHVNLFDNDIGESHRRHYPSMYYARAFHTLKDTLDQGFTTVRDAGGADSGFREAVNSGFIQGPDITVCGKAITMTGGHADPRFPTEICLPDESPFSGAVADGVAEVQKAAREQLRRGVDYLKIMAGGGCGSPADEPDTTQYTLEELKAIVHEADAVGKKTLSHCYSNRSMKMCADAGVYSIEHGNYLDMETAKYLKEKNCWLVPTLTTYFYITDHGEELGIPSYFLRKMRLVREDALEAVENAMKAGVNIGSGSDAVGDAQLHKGMEIELKSKVMGAMGALISATRENAKLLGKIDKIGTIEQGKFADMLLIDGDPIKAPAIFQDRNNIKAIIRRGKFYKKSDF